MKSSKLFTLLFTLGSYLPALAQGSATIEPTALTWPRWCTSTVATLISERDRGRSDLYALDLEVDVLATALLQMDEPEYAVQLYREWYKDLDGQPHLKRSPAAVLLEAKGLLQTARKALSANTPEVALEAIQKAKPDKDQGGGQLNVYAGVMKLLIAPLIDLRNVCSQAYTTGSGPDQAANIGFWLEQGLYKPAKNDSTEAKAATATASSTSKSYFKFYDFSQRQKLSPFDAYYFILAYLKVRAEIGLELGDLVFRGTGKGNPTAEVYYQDAYFDLYWARILDVTDKEIGLLSDSVMDRLTWCREGMKFGGDDFNLMLMPPAAPATMIAEQEKRLTSFIGELDKFDQRERAQRQTAQTWAHTLANQEGDRKALKEQFQFQMELNIQQRMGDLRSRVVNIKHTQTAAALGRAVSELDLFYKGGSLRLDQTKYAGEISRERGRLLDECISRIGEIDSYGSLLAFRDDLRDVSYAGDRWERVDKVFGNFDEIPVRSAWASVVRQFNRESANKNIGAATATSTTTATASPPSPAASLAATSRPSGVIGSLFQEMRAADLEVQIIEEKIKYQQDAKAEKSIETEAKQVNKKLTEAFQDLEAIQNKSTSSQADASNVAQYNLYRDQILPTLNSEHEKANKMVDGVRKSIKDFQRYCQEAQKAVAEIKKTRQMLSEAHKRYESIVQTASNLPVTISGTLSGVVTDPGGTIQKAGKAALDMLENGYGALGESKSSDDFIQQLNKEAGGLDAKLASAQTEVNRVKTEMAERAAKANIQAYFNPPKAGNPVFAELKKTFTELRSLPENISVGNLKSQLVGSLEGATSAIENEGHKHYEKINKLAGAGQTKLKEIEAGDGWKDCKQQEISALQSIAVLETRQAVADAKFALLGERNAAYADKVDGLKLQVSQARAMTAKLRWEAAAADQHTAWRRLENAISRLASLGQEQNNLVSLTAEFRETINRLESDKANKEDANQKSESELDDVGKDALEEINILTERLRELQSPSKRMLTKDLIDRMAPALIAMEGNQEAKAEKKVLLDEANKALVAYGRWLFALTGDKSLIFYASPCSSLGEVRLAKRELDKRRDDLNKHFATSQPVVFAVGVSPTVYSGNQPLLIQMRQKNVQPVKAASEYLTAKATLEAKADDSILTIQKYSVSDEGELNLPLELLNARLLGIIPVHSGQESEITMQRPSTGSILATSLSGETANIKRLFLPLTFGACQTNLRTLSRLSAARKISTVLSQNTTAIHEQPWTAGLPFLEGFGGGVEGLYRFRAPAATDPKLFELTLYFVVLPDRTSSVADAKMDLEEIVAPKQFTIDAPTKPLGDKNEIHNRITSEIEGYKEDNGLLKKLQDAKKTQLLNPLITADRLLTALNLDHVAKDADRARDLNKDFDNLYAEGVRLRKIKDAQDGIGALPDELDTKVRKVERNLADHYFDQFGTTRRNRIINDILTGLQTKALARRTQGGASPPTGAAPAMGTPPPSSSQPKTQ